MLCNYTNNNALYQKVLIKNNINFQPNEFLDFLLNANSKHQK